MKLNHWVLLLVLGAGCADTGGSAAGAGDTSPCEGVECPVGTICVAGLCREGATDVGTDDVEVDSGADTADVADAPDVPREDVSEDIADTSDVPEEPDVPAPHAEVTVEPAALAMTVATEGEQIERNLTVFNVGNRGGADLDDNETNNDGDEVDGGEDEQE